MAETKMKTQLDRDLASLEKIIAGLFVSLKRDIRDDYRASDDPDDNTPGMQVTIGFTPKNEGTGKDWSWSYQTGDNSYSGGAYGHPHWGVVSLYRRSNSRELAKDCVDQIGEGCIC